MVAMERSQLRLRLLNVPDSFAFRQSAADKKVDAAGPNPYIGGGPRLPNEVLSFWKE
jgi:hypothetical protein